MCGMVGVLTPGGADRLSPHLEQALSLLRHRGPDDQSIYQAGPVALGHARLSIIDRAGGRQPLANEDGSVQALLTGEIFNYRELRADLCRAGHRFRSASDTEVLVHLYEERGAELLGELNGQFAIALWDARRRRLLLARDRVGIRPLYYTQVGEALLFASEIKALLAFPGVPRALDPQGLAQVFTLWTPLGERTLFTGIRQLRPGHRLLIEDPAAPPRPQRYYDLTFPAEDALDSGRAADERAEELRALLTDAVRLQLHADVPVGAYLSGGLDSTALCALAQRQLTRPLRTFSVAFVGDDGAPAAEFDEGQHQEQAARALGSEHHTLRVRPGDVAAAFPRLLWHCETALLRSAPAPLMLLSRAVSQGGCRVVLTGEGADEVFGGYDLFKEAALRRFWARRPASKLRPRLLTRLYPYLQHIPPAFAAQFFGQRLTETDLPYYGHLPRILSTRRSLRFLRPEAREAASADPLEELCAELPGDFGRWAPLCRDQYLEMHTLLSGYLLSAQGDRVAMAHGVEGRVPFLDHRVIEFAARLPPALKLLGLREKVLLRRSLRGLMPEAMRVRPKQPYRAPDAECFFHGGALREEAAPLAELLSHARLRDQGFFSPEATGRLLDKARRGQRLGASDNMALMGIVSTMLLDELFVRNHESPGNLAPPSL